MDQQLMGLELELSFLRHPGAPEGTPSPDEFAQMVLKELHPKGVGMFHLDGSKIYWDNTTLELCPRPGRSAREAVAIIRAAERRMRQTVERLAAPYVIKEEGKPDRPGMTLIKSPTVIAIDEDQTHPDTRGIHENYGRRIGPGGEPVEISIEFALEPFLIARPMLTESGDVLADAHGNAIFVRAPKAVILHGLSGIATKKDIGSSSPDYLRVEARTQSPNYSDETNIFKLEMTSLVLRALERERALDDNGQPLVPYKKRLSVLFPETKPVDVDLEQSDDIYSAYAAWHGVDPVDTLPVIVNGVSRMMSALDLLDVYRELVEHYIPVAEMSDDERYTMEQWKIRSDLLRSHPERAVGVLEWATREAYFERVQKKFIERTGKPLTYEQGKFVMSLIEIDTDDPKQNAKKARQLAGLLSNGRVLTTAEIDAAELPGEDEGLQYVRAQAVKEILTWEPHDREHVEMDWDSAIVPDHIPAPGRVEADYRDEKIVHIRVLDLNGMDATEAVTTLRNAYERRVDPASLRQDDAHQVHQISTRVDHHFGPGIEL